MSDVPSQDDQLTVNFDAHEVRVLVEVLIAGRRAMRHATSHSDVTRGIPLAQLNVLRQLVHDGPDTPVGLAEQLGRARSTISNLLDALDRDGLICRVQTSSDRRSTVIHATADAAHLVKSEDTAQARTLVTALHRLTPAQQSDVRRSLPALSDLMTALTARAAAPDTATN